MNCSLLKDLKFAIFGLDSSKNQPYFNVIALDCDNFLFKLGCERFLPLAFCDENKDIEEEVLESNNESDSKENGSEKNYFLMAVTKKDFFKHRFNDAPFIVVEKIEDLPPKTTLSPKFWFQTNG